MRLLICWIALAAIANAVPPPPAPAAVKSPGWVALYNGRDLTNFRADPGHEGHWQPRGEVLAYDGKSTAADKNLWTEREYGDFELTLDWRFTGKPVKRSFPIVLPNGEHEKNPDGTDKKREIDDYGDSGVYVRGSSKSQVNLWSWPIGSGEVYGYRTDAKMPAEVRAGVTPRKAMDRPPGEWNRMRITMRGEFLTVVLNGETVIERARLPGVAARGRLALQHHGDPIEFAHVHVREIAP